MTTPAAPLAIDRIRLPRRELSPFAQVARRVGFALVLVVFVALVVRLGRGGYVDGELPGASISILDSLYYASVTVTTTGYGDITPVSSGARLATLLLITPARILFLILVVSTTVEVLTDESRRLLLTRRWRNSVSDHTLILGFGDTGQAAARDLLRRGLRPSEITVVDIEPEAIETATKLGMVAVLGDASQTAVLRQAGIETAKTVIVVPNRDDTSVLVTLTVREISPTVHLVAGVRDQENLHLLRQGGADEVVDETANVGRTLGISAVAPSAARVLDDLLIAGAGLELAECDGSNGVPEGCTLVAVLRNDERLRPDQVDLDNLRASDRLVILRET